MPTAEHVRVVCGSSGSNYKAHHAVENKPREHMLYSNLKHYYKWDHKAGMLEGQQYPTLPQGKKYRPISEMHVDLFSKNRVKPNTPRK